MRKMESKYLPSELRERFIKRILEEEASEDMKEMSQKCIVIDEVPSLGRINASRRKARGNIVRKKGVASSRKTGITGETIRPMRLFN